MAQVFPCSGVTCAIARQGQVFHGGLDAVAEGYVDEAQAVVQCFGHVEQLMLLPRCELGMLGIDQSLLDQTGQHTALDQHFIGLTPEFSLLLER